MGEDNQQSGGCLCGKVRFRITVPAREVSVCHCSMCRRWNGGPAFAIECDRAVVFEGEEHIVRYKSSDWAERCFCGICGSNLFYFLIGEGQYIINAGTLDDQSGLEMTTQIFIEEKPGFYTFANETKMMTGEEVFALYALLDEKKE